MNKSLFKQYQDDIDRYRQELEALEGQFPDLRLGGRITAPSFASEVYKAVTSRISHLDKGHEVGVYLEGHPTDILSLLQAAYQATLYIAEDDAQEFDKERQKLLDEINAFGERIAAEIKMFAAQMEEKGKKLYRPAIRCTSSLHYQRAVLEAKLSRAIDRLWLYRELQLRRRLVQANIHDTVRCYRSRKDLPTDTPGVYFLFDDELQYIGQSQDIRSRLSGHHVYEDGKYLIGVLAPIEDRQERIKIEQSLIRQLAPTLNRTGNVYQQIPTEQLGLRPVR
mgnify:FL=1